MVSQPGRQEEIESIQRICRLILEEIDPVQFNALLRELDELLQKEQHHRKQNGQSQAPL